MNSKIFEKIGIGNIDPAYIFVILLVLLVGVLVYAILTANKLKQLSRKYDNFMRGKDAETLEDVIIKRFEQVDTLIVENEKKTKEIAEIFDNLKTTVQKCGIVKYDAFHEMGGKLSFALVMLDKNNTGHVINAMHSREGCYIYIKEIIKGESYIPLGDEEKKALDKALGNDVQ
ncbi:MAG: DUF4446 family protein [Lachnospiraceae bacterium]|nr:DUF4446 family protein [Lachnospiraceae bacterium]